MGQQSDNLSELSTGFYRIARGSPSDKISGMAKPELPLKKLVGRRLRAVRKALRRDTKQGMADLFGVKHDRYSSWEAGRNLLPIEYGLILEKRYNVNLSWLYSDDPERMALELNVSRSA
jgi:hypothetical protein